MRPYGFSLHIDLHGCNHHLFTRDKIDAFFKIICDMLGAEKEDVHFWDDVGLPEEEKQTDPRLVGTSAIQFILTSGITVHTLDLRKEVYIDIFSCDEFDPMAIGDWCAQYWCADKMKRTFIDRGIE